MLTPGTWKSPSGSEELLLASDLPSSKRLLIVPPLFEEHNKLRHFLVATMRLLEQQGVAAVLTDLPGTNESETPLASLSLTDWRDYCTTAHRHCKTTHILAVRGGSLCAPQCAQTAHFAPVSGKALLRGLLRAQVLADREAGLNSDRERMLQSARSDGATLMGYRFGANLVTELEAAEPNDSAITIAQADLGGSALWLRAEPSHDAGQAEALSSRIAEWMG